MSSSYNFGGPKSFAGTIRSAHEANARLRRIIMELREALQEMTAAHQREDPHHEDMCSNCLRAQRALKEEL